jgi:hypothetical protein
MPNWEWALKVWLKSSASMSVSNPQFIPPMYSTILFMFKNNLFSCPLSPRLYRKTKQKACDKKTRDL